MFLDDDNVNIVIPGIYYVIQFFRNNISHKLHKLYITIQLTNMYDLSLIFVCLDFNASDIQHIVNITPPNTKYLCINDVIFINHRLRETYFDTIIYRNTNSFHQCDENIRIQLYNEIKMLFVQQYDFVIFVGGEMYIYGKLFDKSKIFYSDYMSIVDDAKINIECKHIYHTDYLHIILTIPEHTNMYGSAILINNSNGLSVQLYNQIIEHNISYIYIISCKYNCVINDYNMLKHKYTINKFIKIKSNYEIYLICYIATIAI
jgi:hypothetical protein